MGLKIISPDDFKESKPEVKPDEPLKAEISKQGMLDIEFSAISRLKMRNGSYVKFAVTDMNELCMILCDKKDDETYSVVEFFSQYMVGDKGLFEKYDYLYPVKIELIRDTNYPDQQIYKLVKQE